MPSYPFVMLTFASMQDDGHQRLLLHLRSDFGMASPINKFSAGLTMADLLNHGRVVNLITPIFKSSPLS